MNKGKLKKVLSYGGLALIGLLILIQFIPVQHTNPPISREVQWDSPQTRQLAQRACFDCHSSETVWPWYAKIAPISWLVVHDVNDGRRRLNFSTWDHPNENEREMTEAISRGQMPLWYYILVHPDAKLTQTEQQALINGLKQTLTNDPPIARQRRQNNGG